MTGPHHPSPSFQFYPRDWLANSSVRRMTLAERGAYIDLLAYAWQDGGLPDDDAELARMLQITVRAWRTLAPRVRPRFAAWDGRLVNTRLERVRDEQAAYRAAKAAAGRQSGVARGHQNSAATDDEQNGNTSLNKPRTKTNPASASASAGTTATAVVTRAAPLHDRSHRQHAHCGRICLHASQFGEFVRRRNHPDADREIRDWCLAVEREWGPDGPRADDEPGDAFAFWKARYAEQWPATPTASPSPPSAAELEQRRNTAKYARPGP